jgi:hypothetical protein
MGPSILVTFYQQLVLRKPLNHQLLEILGRKYLASLDIQCMVVSIKCNYRTKVQPFPLSYTINVPACKSVSLVNKYSIVDTSLLTEIVFAKDACLFLIKTDLICLETDAVPIISRLYQ